MAKDFSEIVRLVKLRRTMQEAKREADALSSPLLNDYTLMGDVYRTFCRTQGIDGISGKIWRRRFLAVAVFLYSPASLLGTRMRKGLRGAVARCAGCSLDVLSRDVRYACSACFRSSSEYSAVRDAFSLVLSALRDEGAI